MEALRQEKRAIQLEERRLKALLDIEKAKATRAADRQAAARAERHRRQAKVDYRREKVRAFVLRPLCTVSNVWRLLRVGAILFSGRLCFQYVELQKQRDETEHQLLAEKHAVEKRREAMEWAPPTPRE